MRKMKNLVLVFIFMVSCFVGAYYSVNREEMKNSEKADVDMRTYLDLELKNIEVFAGVLAGE